MGSYAFASEPDYVVHIDRNALAGARWVAGVDEQWNMPAALFDVRGGFDNQTEPDSIRHHTAKWRVSGSQVHARASGSGVQSDPMGGTSVCLQARGSRARYWAGDDLHCAHIYWPDDLIRELATAIHQERGDRADLLIDDTFFSDDVLLARMAEGYLRRALVASDTPTILEMDARSIAFCTHVIIRHSLIAHAYIRKLPSQLTPNQLSRAIDLMCAPSDKPVRLGQIARAAGVSTFHFCRGFHKSIGMAPHQWLINSKIERAKKLLCSSKKSIMEIAALLNYDDPSYFARLFKKHTGKSPGTYR